MTSDPAGISCPPTCTAQFAEGKIVRLTATVSGGSVFGGWSGGGCSGTSTTCQLTMPANAVNIIATFNPPSLSKRTCPPTSLADQPPAGLTITSPVRDDLLKWQNDSRGTASLASGEHLWLLLCAPDVRLFYFVSEEHRETLEKNGIWQDRVYLKPEEQGNFSLYAVVVNAEDSQKLDQTVDQARDNGVESPFIDELPPSARYFRVAVRCCS